MFVVIEALPLFIAEWNMFLVQKYATLMIVVL